MISLSTDIRVLRGCKFSGKLLREALSSSRLSPNSWCRDMTRSRFQNPRVGLNNSLPRWFRPSSTYQDPWISSYILVVTYCVSRISWTRSPVLCFQHRWRSSGFWAADLDSACQNHQRGQSQKSCGWNVVHIEIRERCWIRKYCIRGTPLDFLGFPNRSYVCLAFPWLILDIPLDSLVMERKSRPWSSCMRFLLQNSRVVVASLLPCFLYDLCMTRHHEVRLRWYQGRIFQVPPGAC